MWNQLTPNKRYFERDLIREHSLHKEKLIRASSRIDNQSPRSMIHVRHNLKGKFLAKSRNEFINHSNRILVDKLCKVNSRDFSLQNYQKKLVILNKSKKIENISKITHENFRIMDKINTSKTHYSVKKLRDDYRYSVNLRTMISKNSNRVPKTIDFNHDIQSNSPIANKSSKSLHNTGKIDSLVIL